MSSYYVRLTFYGREHFVDFPCTKDEYRDFFAAARKLAEGSREVNGHYLLSVAEDVKALVAIKEVQAVYFLEGEKAAANNVQNGTKLLDSQGVSLYLKGRSEPLHIASSGGGPLGDMIAGLIDTGYGEEGFDCVMLADDDGNSVFFVLDEVQFAVVSNSLLGSTA